jgi:hypothetical protein
MSYAYFDKEHEIWPLNETVATCSFSVDSCDNQAVLESVKIEGRMFSAYEIAAWLGSGEVQRIEKNATEWWNEEANQEDYY